MKISIVIPTLNEAERIGRLVSYLQFYGSDLLREVIVVDSENSNDGTSIIAQQAGAKVLTSPAACRALQMNIGARVAQGEILYFVHADVIPPQSFARDIILQLKNEFEVGYFACRFDGHRDKLRRNERCTYFNNIFTGGGDQSMFISKQLFDQLKGFDEYYILMEDFDFIRKLRRRKIPFSIVQKPVMVSSRKYDNNSYCRVQLANLGAFLLFHLGSNPNLIKQQYRRWLRS